MCNSTRFYLHGLTFYANYIFSKELDNLGSNRNPYNGALDRAVGSTDRPHVVLGTVVWVLPFGKGQNMNPSNPVVSQIVSHWQVFQVVDILQFRELRLL